MSPPPAHPLPDPLSLALLSFMQPAVPPAAVLLGIVGVGMGPAASSVTASLVKATAHRWQKLLPKMIPGPS